MPEYTDEANEYFRKARWKFGLDVGTILVAVPNGHLIASPKNIRGVKASEASDADFKAYALRLLQEAK